jgi:hypothetical protein
MIINSFECNAHCAPGRDAGRGENQPSFHDVLVNPLEYAKEIAVGFTTLYQLLMRDRADLSPDAGCWHASSGLKCGSSFASCAATACCYMCVVTEQPVIELPQT